MSLHHVFLRIGLMVSDVIRDLSVDMLDLGDLWFCWERDELYIADVHGFISPRGSGSDRSYLGQGNLDTGWYSQLAGRSWCLGMSCLPRGSMCYFVSG